MSDDHQTNKPTVDPDVTWDPSVNGGTVASDGVQNAPSAVDRVRLHKSTDTNAAASPNATFLPTRTGSVDQLWGGGSLTDASPYQTLKSPTDASPSDSVPYSDVAENAKPDLSNRGYELLDQLGEGGVGIVYRAIQQSVDRSVAVKLIKRGVGRNEREQEKFIAEALTTGKLDHPNIVPIHDLDATDDGQPFYTMKMVRGTPWNEVIRDKSLKENLSILLDVCDAVSFAHSRDVIHRDLKPENVMLGQFGEVQVMDWGLGAAVSIDGALSDPSQTHAVGGTPAYMAPEMVTGDDGPVGKHSDVYLLGAILFEIVVGKPPHPGRRALDALENARNNVIIPVEDKGVLMEIAMHAMQTAPAHRCGSVSEYKQAVLDYQSHAESIVLSHRASDDLAKAKETQDYDIFSAALFGFRGALKLWQDNSEAQDGVAETQLQYARCAFAKQDLDLAASLLDSSCETHRHLLDEIGDAQTRRDIARKRLRRFRTAALALTTTVVIVLTVAYIWINAARREAVAAKVDAIRLKEVAFAAGKAESKQRKLAESAMSRAQTEEARAVQALADLKKTYAELVESQEKEKRAWAEARASELVATEARDELAKTGMLLDNSWWTFDAARARQVQWDTAEAAGKPIEQVISLSGDVKMEMVFIPPGEFVMGSPPEEENRSADEHLHRVRHTAGFYLNKYELTVAQWQALTGLPSTSREKGRNTPVTGVTYEQVMTDLLPALQAFAPEGYEFRLPTEAQWEYACRAGSASAYYTGQGDDALEEAGWFLTNSNQNVQAVGGKKPNPFGLYDMHGNAGEICLEQYSVDFYLESPIDDPLGSTEGQIPVVRGGSVLNTSEHCRCAYRSYVYSKNAYPFLGVRPALVSIRDAGPPRLADGDAATAMP